MKLSFLIQLILLIILIVGVYLVFTNNVSGRSKLILIVFLAIIGVYLFSKFSLFKSYNDVIEDPVTAKEHRIIESNKLKPTNGHFTLSSWIYVDDWNYRYRQKKHIIERGESLPRIYLDEYTNDLVIELNVMQSSESDFKNAMRQTLLEGGITDISSEDLECSGGYIKDTRNDTFYDGNNQTSEYSCTNSDVEIVRIDNINLQKWVNIILSVSNRNIDVYINGKLVKTQTFNNVIDTGALNNGDISITKDGGFGGFISKVQYYPYFITPKKAWSIYRDGFGDAFASALNKYNLSVTFYEDAVEKKKYWIF